MSEGFDTTNASWLAAPDAPPWMAELSDHLYLRELGSGAQKSVHLLFDNTLRRHVAVSAYALNPDNQSVWMREARVLAQVGTHPNLTTVYQVHASARFGLIVCQFIDGWDLAREISTRRPLSAARCIALARQLAGALLHVHRAGIVHGDIKPGNVLSVGDDAFFLTDFGMSRLMSAGARGLHATGTPRYMAPELFAGATPGTASDAWSFGCLLFEAATGTPVFSGSMVEVIRAHSAADLAQRVRTAAAALAAPLDALIAGLLRAAPDDRMSLAAAIALLDAHTTTQPRRSPALLPVPIALTGARQSQQRQLHHHIANLPHGSGFALAVVGDDGMGKTTLVSAALGAAPAPTCLRVSCAGNQAPPGWSLQTAIRNLCRGEPWATRLHSWIADGEALGQFLATLPTDSSQERWAVFDSLLRFLGGQALVVVIEDLEDSDPFTQAFAACAGPQAAALGLGLICTARAQVPAGFEVIGLDPLAPDEIHTIAATARSGLTRVELAAIERSAGGNPMIARLLAAGSTPGIASDSASLQAVLRRRLQAASADVRTLLGVVAALGGSCYRSIIEDVLAACREQLSSTPEALLAETLAAGWLHNGGESGMLSLAQPFLQQALASHTPARQIRVMTRLIEGSNSLDDDSRATLLASLYLQLPGEAAAARLTWTLAAVRVHRLRGNPAAGIELAERALRAAEADGAAAPLGELHQELGECKLSQGSLAYAQVHFETAWQHATAQHDPELAARAAIGLSGGFSSPLGPDFSQLRERLDSVINSTVAEPLLTVARARRSFVHTSPGLPTLDDNTMQVLSAAMLQDSDLARAHALLACLHRNWPVLDSAEINQLLDRAACHAERLGNEILSFIIRTNRLVNTFRAGDLSAMQTLVNAAAARQDLGNPALRNEILGSRAGLALARGEFAEAAACASQLSVDDSTSALMSTLINFHLAHEQGAGQQLTASIDNMLQMMPGQSGVVAYAAWHFALLDQPARARPLLERLLADEVHLQNADFTWTSTLVALAEVCWMLADERGAAALLPVFERLKAPYVTQSFVMMYGPRDYFVGSLAGLCGDRGRAEAALRQAALLSERLPNPAFRQRARRRLEQSGA